MNRLADDVPYAGDIVYQAAQELMKEGHAPTDSHVKDRCFEIVGRKRRYVKR